MASKKTPPKSKWSRSVNKGKTTRKPALTRKQEAVFFHLLGGGSRDDVPE